MNEKLKNNLRDYLIKKGMEVEINNNYIIDIFYYKEQIKFCIKLYLNSKMLDYSTVNYYPIYGYDYVGKRRKGIYNLKTKYTRKDFNRAVYLNILKIQKWLDPHAHEKKIKNENINKYAKELEFYFNDKYGNINLTFSNTNTKNIKIFANFNTDYSNDTQDMSYTNGEYFLNSIHKQFKHKKIKIYKQRKKK